MKTLLKLSFLATILIFCEFAYAAPGSLLWGDNFDREGTGYDVATPIAVTGTTVFVAGATETSAGGAAFTVRAYSAKDGSLLWGDNFDREGDLDDIANAVAVQGKKVFVAGLTETSAGGAAFTVRAYSAKDGSLLWENFFDREGTGYDVATAIAVTGTTVFVAGATETSAGGAAFTVRAYSAKDGSLLWRDNFDREGTGDDVATTMAVRSRVSVAEATYDGGEWKVKIVRRTTVFVAGATRTSAGGAAFTLRAYSTKNNESRTF
jgi:TolB-like protein